MSTLDTLWWAGRISPSTPKPDFSFTFVILHFLPWVLPFQASCLVSTRLFKNRNEREKKILRSLPATLSLAHFGSFYFCCTLQYISLLHLYTVQQHYSLFQTSPTSFAYGVNWMDKKVFRIVLLLVLCFKSFRLWTPIHAHLPLISFVFRTGFTRSLLFLGWALETPWSAFFFPLPKCYSH